MRSFLRETAEDSALLAALAVVSAASRVEQIVRRLGYLWDLEPRYEALAQEHRQLERRELMLIDERNTLDERLAEAQRINVLRCAANIQSDAARRAALEQRNRQERHAEDWRRRAKEAEAQLRSLRAELATAHAAQELPMVANPRGSK